MGGVWSSTSTEPEVETIRLANLGAQLLHMEEMLGRILAVAQNISGISGGVLGFLLHPPSPVERSCLLTGLRRFGSSFDFHTSDDWLCCLQLQVSDDVSFQHSVVTNTVISHMYLQMFICL